jgi:hypothetical protein
VRYLRDLVADGYIGRLRSVDLYVALPVLGAVRPKPYDYAPTFRTARALRRLLDTIAASSVSGQRRIWNEAEALR